MQILKEKNRRSKVVIMNEISLSRLEINSDAPSKVVSESECSTAACLKCINPRCMYFDSKEIECDKLTEFSFDKGNIVCPSDALSWNELTENPCIDQGKCIDCGLCAARCPIGAIYYNKDKFIINTEYDNLYNLVLINKENIDKHFNQIDNLVNTNRQGEILKESDEILKHIYNKVSEIGSKGNFPNKLIRNIMIGLGTNCSITRVGDVYTRMDAVYQTGANTFGAIEVEFGKDTLDASRGILDDIAVLHSRYGIDKHNNTALVVCLSLPNMRQGYWQVIKDINKVERIEINTITLGAMLILLWNFFKLDLKINSYYADYDKATIRKYLEENIGRKINISNNILGILEPNK